MLFWGLTLVVVGLIVAFAAFCFAALNMSKMMKGQTSFPMDSMFGRHFGAMIAAAFGGLLFAVGLVLCAVNVLSRFVH